MTEPQLTPDEINAIVRNPDDPRYPTRLGVFCDDCGAIFEGDFIVHEGMTGWQRLAVVRKHVRSLGWSCAPEGDFCAACVSSAKALAVTEAQPSVPRTERSYWVAIADALNAAAQAGMPVGIDLDGTLTDRHMWSVVWDRTAERWTVAGYEDDDTEATAAPETDPDAPAGPGLSWARQLDTPTLAQFLGELSETAIRPLDAREALAEVERVLGTWALTALAASADDEPTAAPCRRCQRPTTVSTARYCRDCIDNCINGGAGAEHVCRICDPARYGVDGI